MTNKEVAAVLEEIALLLELAGENPFKSRTYANMARRLETWDEDVETLVSEQRLRDIPGLGDALESKITELVTKGTLEYHQDLRKQFPDSLFELFDIQGLGAKKIKALYDELGIDSMKKLEKACKDDKVAGLKGFGKRTQEKILEGIEFARTQSGQFRLDIAWTEADRLRELLGALKGVKRLEVAGSLRRSKELVKDIDVLVSSDDPKPIMKAFVEAEGVVRVTGHGEKKSSVMLESGINADLRVVSDEEFPFALAYFTGSKEHNVVMRQRAKERGLKLNEYGLFKEDDTSIPCADEKDIFKALDLPYIPPELREDMGEDRLKKTPKLITLEELRGTVHNHSTYSDGRASLEEMAKTAKKLGYEYFGIADHSQTASYAGGLSVERLRAQWEEIDKLNKKLKPFRILKGIESDILADGSLDYEDEILAEFDYVVASVHFKMNMTEKEATKRLVKAVENPYTTILGHPTTRLLLQRDGFPIHWDTLFDAAAANRTAIEINANPRRLDIDWRHIHRGREKGVMFCICPDAHRPEGLELMRYGVGIARKGGLTAKELLNSRDADAFIAWKKG